MKKKTVSAVVAITLVFAVLCGTVTPQLANPLQSSADSSVYNFDYGSGITWGKDDELPTFAPITANKNNRMDAYVAHNFMSKSPNTQFNNDSVEVKYAMSTLQGLVNRTRPQIIMMSDAQEGLETWPKELVGSDNYTKTTDYIYMVNKYKSYIKGMIVYNDNVKDTINVATSIAGATDCIVVSTGMASELTQKCGLSVKLNFNNINSVTDNISAYNYLYNYYYKTGLLNKRLIIGLDPVGHAAYTRDLAVATKSAVLWLEPNNKAQCDILDKFFSEATVGVTYNMGWWPQEDTGICYATKQGVSTIPSDCFENATVYMAGSKKLNIPAVPAKPELKNKIYVALTVSDGDNIQYNEHVMKILWESFYRSKYPISWTVSPSLYYCAPQMLNYYNKTLGNSALISGPSGIGYTKATRWRYKEGFLDKFASSTNEAFEKTGLNVVTLWDRISEDCYAEFASKMKSVLGVTINNNGFNDKDRNWADAMYGGGNNYKYYPANGSFDYKSEIPILGLGSPVGYCEYPDNSGIRDYFDALATGYDSSSPVFRVVQITPWGGKQTSDFTNFAKRLEEKYPNKFEFIRADHLFMLANEYNGHAYNLALQKNATASHSDNGVNPKNANDGSFTTGWSASNGSDKWYQIDLGQRSRIKRYVLKNAETGYYSADKNTKAFKFEYSLDGEVWTTADTVSNNTSDIVYRDVSVEDARYVRIKITDPGSDSVARIQDLEVYGMPMGDATRQQLQTSIDECKNYTQGTLTDYIWNKFTTARDNAEAVLNNENSSAEKIEEAYSNLLAARKALMYDVPATEINVPSSVSVGVNETYGIHASLSPANTTDAIVSWVSTDPSVASVTNGVITGKKSGIAVITVQTNRGLTKTITVRVSQKVTGMSISRTLITLKKGDALRLQAFISPANASNKNVNWKSSNSNVVTVNAGQIYAKNGGTATISAVSDDNPAIYKNCKVTVLPPVSKVTLNKKKVIVKKGKKVTVKAKINPTNAYNGKVKWSTSNRKIATVSGGKIKGIYGGAAVVTAKAGGKTARVKVNVNGLSKGNKAYYKNGKKLRKKWVKVSRKWYYANAKGKITKIVKKR